MHLGITKTPTSLCWFPDRRLIGALLPVIFWAMLPDTIEYGEYRTGIRAESRTFGFATFA